MYLELDKSIPKDILLSVVSLTYKTLQHAITKDDCWKMLKHFLLNWYPYLSGKVKYLQKQIYDLQVLFKEFLAYFINRTSILHKILLSRQDVPPNLLFEKFLTKLMVCQVFNPFLVPS